MPPDSSLEHAAMRIMATPPARPRHALSEAIAHDTVAAADPRAHAHRLDFNARLVTRVRQIAEARSDKPPWACP